MDNDGGCFDEEMWIMHHCYIDGTMDPKYPNITVQLTGKDGNAWAIIARVTNTLRKEGIDTKEIKAFQEECKTGDYNHLLQTCMKWVEVE